MTTAGPGSEEPRQAQDIRRVFDTIPTLAWSARSDGSADFFNRRWLDYTGLSIEQARDWGWAVALYPDDLNRLVDYWRSVLASREPGEIEARLRRVDGVYRWFLFRATPSFDSEGAVVQWFGTNTDIEDRKRAEYLLSGQNLVLEMTAKGNSLEAILEALCRVVEEATGCSCSVLLIDPSGAKIEQAVAPSLPSSYHDRFPGTPVDREGGPCLEAVRQKTQVIVSDVASETRWDANGWRTAALAHGLKACWSTTILASNGLVLGTFAIYWREPRSPSGQDQEIIGQMTHLAAVAIERKRSEAALTRAFDEIAKSEVELRTIIDAIPQLIIAIGADGNFLYANEAVLEYTGLTKEEVRSERFGEVFHPEDSERLRDKRDAAISRGAPFEYERRVLRRDGQYRWLLVQYNPLLDERGEVIRWYATGTDIDDRKREEDALRLNERSLRLTVDSIPGFISVANAAGEIELVNRQVLEYFGKTTEDFKNWDTSDHNHPDDLPRMIETYRHAIETGQPLDLENRSRGTDGVYRWFHLRGRPQRDAEGRIVRWYNLATDIDDRKRAEEDLRRSESFLTEAQHLSRTGSFGCNVSSGEMFWSEETFRIFGYDRTTRPSVETILQRVHPEDKRLVQEQIARATSECKDCDLEYRLLLPDDSVKHVHVVAHAVNDGPGGFEFLGAVMDVTEQRQARAELEQAFVEIKRLKDRLHNENVALREEIDKASMFEEIVGNAPPLQRVLSRLSKVAPTDSNVLITGETGTGKELVARAIHRRSRRASRAFVSVNCAAIPRDLIASELFGHEKGAFTGAAQRRLGRFELAEGGTIFLDEISELPAETQIALLRVLQEHEFERLGGEGSIRTNVRVIAAANRDLEAAISAGTFRSDLFYRLNVFPIEIPSLRERTEDIPLLVEYFIDRYARKAGKSFRAVNKKSLDLLQSYSWPGNIRELQNVIERSVIVCETENFSVDESWFSRQPADTGQDRRRDVFKRLPVQEKAIIEGALRESSGRVYGPSGAAAKLGMPRSTLESKIRSFKINKNRFKSAGA